LSSLRSAALSRRPTCPAFSRSYAAADVRAAVSEALAEAHDMTGVAVFAYPGDRGVEQRWPGELLRVAGSVG
jgi:hypothetical protein